MEDSIWAPWKGPRRALRFERYPVRCITYPSDYCANGLHGTARSGRRSRLLYRLAFGPNVEVGVFAARFSEYDADA